MVFKWTKRIRFLHKHEFPREMSLTDWISKAILNQHATVVQIGSNDGKTRDPLYPLMKEHICWHGLFVEPVPYLLERLRGNYMSLASPNRFHFYNGAVNDGSPQDFYFIDPHAKYVIPGLPDWYDQIGSFDRLHILGHMEGRLAPFILRMKVKGTTLPVLLDMFCIKHIDLLHIDAEGYDWAILSQLDLQTFIPKIIIFEHKHLSENELNQSVAQFSEEYEIFLFKNDFLCLLKNEHSISTSDMNFLRSKHKYA
ncbi:FkbM family methyltransferase [Pleomorphovibrio marinus]|uniref:FkbM family methyltransferase n=1 Tax=Pleomorphovibrio marinus TaxID=2164132 RepID=UPI000E0BF50A|nr:FkbM family methyltransferase [Pleomorphovibrio marinus]